jgi:hypothetical protein
MTPIAGVRVTFARESWNGAEHESAALAAGLPAGQNTGERYNCEGPFSVAGSP